MDTVYCPIFGKEYKAVKMHIRKGHGREPEEVIEEAFGQKLTTAERRKGLPQKRRTEETMSQVKKRSTDLRKTQENRLKEMQNSWQNRQKALNRVMKERIDEIINK